MDTKELLEAKISELQARRNESTRWDYNDVEIERLEGGIDALENFYWDLFGKEAYMTLLNRLQEEQKKKKFSKNT
jgi:hypothetical protein